MTSLWLELHQVSKEAIRKDFDFRDRCCLQKMSGKKIKMKVRPKWTIGKTNEWECFDYSVKMMWSICGERILMDVLDRTQNQQQHKIQE